MITNKNKRGIGYMTEVCKCQVKPSVVNNSPSVHVEQEMIADANEIMSQYNIDPIKKSENTNRFICGVVLAIAVSCVVVMSYTFDMYNDSLDQILENRSRPKIYSKHVQPVENRTKIPAKS